jgi:hypothetical protein
MLANLKKLCFATLGIATSLLLLMVNKPYQMLIGAETVNFDDGDRPDGLTNCQTIDACLAVSEDVETN